MALPDDFEDQCLYARRSWYVHDILTLDVDNHRLVGLMHTTDLGPLVDDQIERPGHPKHVPGAVMVQATGTLGQLHAVYAMGLRGTEGWSGFGTHMKEVRFGGLGTIGPDVVMHCEATRRRQLRGTWFVDYSFRYEQDGRELFRSRQTAAWIHAGQ